MIRVSRLLPLLVVLVLTACATNPNQVGVAVGEAERPASDRPPANEAEAKARAHVDLAEGYVQLGNFGVALDEAKTALRYAPNYSPAYLVIATVYVFLDDAAAARANFEEALKLSPGDPEINNSYGWFLCASGQEQQGLERLALAMRNPYYRTPARPYANAGLCYLRMKNDAQAEAAFQRAVQLDPANGLAYMQLAEISYRRGNYETAQKYLASLLKLGPANAASTWLALRVERKLGNKEAAATYAQQLKNRFPTSSEYQLLLQGKID